jgi:glycosyltransferase involved in cell wall biosynthesis
MKTITIVTVVKDDLIGLQRTIDSIQKQETTEYEYLVIDGSGDEMSLQIEAESSRIIGASYFHKKPRGIYDAMNFGVRCATGKYILFLNAGDILVDTKTISTLLTDLSEYPEIDIFAYEVLYVTPHNFFYSIKSPLIRSKKYADFHHQGVLMSREKFKSVGGFDLRYKFAADGDLLDRALNHSDIKLMDKVLVAFDMRGASSSNYWNLLREINLYRNPSSITKRLFLTFKNSLRAYLIMKKLLPDVLVFAYLGHRERKLLGACPKLVRVKSNLL